MTTQAWQYASGTDGIGVLTLDVPERSANTLSSAVLIELEGVLAGIESQPPRGLIIRSGKKSGFIAGADVHEFTTLGSVEPYRGKPARLYLQLFDETFQPAGAPVQRWAGTMDRVVVNRTPSDKNGGGAHGTLEMQCSRYGMARARNAPGLRLNHAQQQMAYAGDLGLEYVAKLIEQPALWLTKAFQRV